MPRHLLLAALAFQALSACAADDFATPDADSDAEAEAADPTPATTKADAASFAGKYREHTTTHLEGDVPDLALTAGTYVRARCYHSNCALELPETDKYDTYTSTTGHTYLRFWSVKISKDSAGNFVTKPVVADVYEVRPITGGITLRKAYTTRWQQLYKTTDAELCTTSHGHFAAGACACPTTKEFVAGAGGCITTPGASEDHCDASGGMWTDDDATAIGSYCVCGIGRYDNAVGSCAKI